MDPENETIDLRDYLRVLRRRRGIIVATFLTAVIATGAITWRMTPIYEAITQVEVQPVSSSNSDSNRLLESLVDPTRALQTQVELVKSKSVLALAAKKLSLPHTKELEEALSVGLLKDTQIVEIKVDHERPEEAKEWANAVGEAYIEFRRQRAIDASLAAAEDMTARIDQVRSRLNEIESDSSNTPTSTATGSRGERDRLNAQLNALEGQLVSLPDAESLRRGGGSTVTPAETPTEPARPNIVLNMAVAVLIGAMLGVGLAFLAENLDDRMRTPEEVEGIVEAAILGYIPYVESWNKVKGPFLAAIDDPASGAAEAYRTLRTNLRFVSLERSLKSILVTSPIAASGKSMTAANLAVVLAQSDARVVLVSGDLRRPSIHNLFSLPNTVGILNALDPMYPLEDTLLSHPKVENLRILPTGGLPPNPTEILASPRFEQILRQLESISDYVIIDSPPILGLGDASAVSDKVDGVIMVIDTKLVTSRELTHATEQVRKAGGRLIGCVLNAIEPEEGYGYYYHYYYSQYEDEASKEAKSAQKAGAPVRSQTDRARH